MAYHMMPAYFCVCVETLTNGHSYTLVRVKLRLGWGEGGSVLIATPDSVHSTFIELQLLLGLGTGLGLGYEGEGMDQF